MDRYYEMCVNMTQIFLPCFFLVFVDVTRGPSSVEKVMNINPSRIAFSNDANLYLYLANAYNSIIHASIT